ncbi:MAG: hypothetical protein WC004_00675 [Candidatus Absconditabacterales bacterium]
MKSNLKTRILGACNVFLIVFGTLILREYMANHTYYYDMLNNTTNIYTIVALLVCAAIPVIYLLYRKNATIKGLTWSLRIGLLVYGILYASVKETILGTGAIMRVINSAIVFGCGLGIITALTGIGAWIHQKLYTNSERGRRQILMSFGIGFVTFVSVNYFLILMHVYYGWVNWLQVGLLVYLTRKTLPLLKSIASTINQSVRSVYMAHKSGGYNRVVIFLLLVSFAYYFVGFKLAYIPYPTAWDANHAYMLIPNAISSAYGHTWNIAQPTGYIPVYLSFVTFFFSLVKGLGAGFWIAPDTFGVEMNYLTAIFTFIITLGIIDKVLHLVENKDADHKKLTQTLGWFAKILRLTSGMGAFLVFVDNKTDFAIMYLSSLGLYAGLGYIDYIIKKYNTDSTDNISQKEGLNDLYISGVFFAVAIASKVTALFDAMNFALLIIGFILGGIVLLGVSLAILAIFANLGLNGVDKFISKPLANILGLGGGTLVTLLGLGKGQHKHSYSYWPRLIEVAKHLAGWVLILVIGIALFKLPIATFRLYHNQTDLQTLPKEIIFGKHNKPILLASNGVLQALGGKANIPGATDIINTDTKVEEKVAAPAAPVAQLNFEQCSLKNVGLSDPKDLYSSLLAAPGDGYNEDVGRYVGFGQKSFANPRRSVLVPNKSCITINKAAKIICENQDLITNLNEANAKLLLGKLPFGSDGYELVDSIIKLYANGALSTHTADSQKLLTDFWHDKTIYKNGSTVEVPYKVVVPLNVTFNRSLQNLSSYYTDIGIMWLMMQFFLVVALIYGLWSRNRLLRTTNLVAVIGWLFWIVIGGGIIWYGIGLITRTIIGFVLFVHSLYEPDDPKSKHADNHILFYLFCGLFIVFGLIQLSLNFVRIASQGGTGPFLQYSYSNGQIVEIDDNLQQTVTVKFPYKRTDILDLQFPFYKKTLNAINAQTGDEINLIAGTYFQYRVNKQSKLMGDGLLVELWTNFSDGNLCKSYLRLKDKKLKYMIIDPNIATIVMGGGNNSLMERFFAKFDPSGKIVTDGTFSTLGKMTNAGYLSLYSSNNLGAKYGFGLSGDYLKNKFGVSSNDDLAMLRARLATVRFWGNQQQMIQVLEQIFTERVVNGEAMMDIADVYGKVVDEENLKILLNRAKINGFPTIVEEVKKLSQDEKFVLLNYLNVLTTYNQQPQQFASVANSIISQSLGGGSQIIVFEVK